jgi:transposase
MIVIGVDVHKRSLTAVAVDELGSAVGERTVATTPVGVQALLAWVAELGEQRLFALEDCRHLSRPLEEALLAAGERLVRVPPKLMAGARRGGRVRGKSDSIDALAVARAALREPRLPQPQPGEQALRELKLLLDHREDLVGERTRLQARLRWHLHELALDDVPAGALDRRCQLQRLHQRLSGCEQTVQTALCLELVARCQQLSDRINELARELEQRVRERAPSLLSLAGCGTLTTAKLLAEIGPITRFQNDAQLAAHAGVAPLPASSGSRTRHRLNRNGNRQLNLALHRIAISQARRYEPARTYLARRQAEGKTRREALRALKRHLARTVYHCLLTDAHLT